jgi:hypothetical protein
MARRGTAQSVASRVKGMTMLGNSGRHQLVAGNKLGSHNKVYRQIRKGMGMSAG